MVPQVSWAKCPDLDALVPEKREDLDPEIAGMARRRLRRVPWGALCCGASQVGSHPRHCLAGLPMPIMTRGSLTCQTGPPARSIRFYLCPALVLPASSIHVASFQDLLHWRVRVSQTPAHTGSAAPASGGRTLGGLCRRLLVGDYRGPVATASGEPNPRVPRQFRE